MRPRTAHPLARHPQPEVIVFRISVQNVLDDLRVTTAAHAGNDIGTFILFAEIVAISELEELQIRVLAVGVVRNTFQAPEQQRLAHRVQVGTQRIHQFHQMRGRITLHPVIIGRTLQRIVQDFIETASHQLFRHQILQLVAFVFIAFDIQRRAHRRRYFHIIIPVHAQDVLHHIARTLHVHTVGRHLKFQPFGRFLQNLHLQTRHDAFHRIRPDVFPHQAVSIFIIQVHHKIGQRIGIYILNLHGYFPACQFLTQHGSLFQGVNHTVRVDTPLETERSIGAQTMTACALANPRRIEISTFQQYVTGRFIRSAPFSAEHTGDTHRLFHVADSQIAVAQLMFLAVERHERRTFRHGLHHHFTPFDHIGIETVQRLSVGEHDVIRHIHDIVDGAQTDRAQFVLQPFRTFLDFAIPERHGGITGACLRVLHFDVDVQLVAVHLKTVARRTVQSRLVAVLHQPGIQVAGHTVMRAGIRTVGRNVHFDKIVALQVIVFRCRGSGYSRLGQHDDAVHPTEVR